MQKIGPMHHLQAVEDRVQNRFEFCLGQDALAVEKVRQGLALGVFHHDIRRAVRLKKMMHAHDVRMLKARQNSGFVDKAIQAPLKIRRRLRRLRHHALVAFAGGEVRRQVLLDRHGNIQREIPAEVGDAKPTVPEDAVKFKISDARPCWQGQFMLCFVHDISYLSPPTTCKIIRTARSVTSHFRAVRKARSGTRPRIFVPRYDPTDAEAIMPATNFQ